MLKVGLTLHKACKLIKLDVSFLQGVDFQVIKRVYKIGQSFSIDVVQLWNKDMSEEKAVKERQMKRGSFSGGAYKIKSADNVDEKEIEVVNLVSD